MDFRLKIGSTTRNTIVSYFRLISFLMVLSALIATSTTKAAPTKDLTKFEIIENPCNYNGHKIRHQRSTPDPAQYVRFHLNRTRRLTDGILRQFRRMYDKSKVKFTSGQFNVPKNITSNSRVKHYLKLQLFVEAIRMLTKRQFESAGKIDSEKRFANLTKLYNESTILLCEMNDDLHYHNLTKHQSVKLGVPLPTSNQSDRTKISIEDQGVLRHYKKFLIKLTQFYHPTKKNKRNDKVNKSEKNTRRKAGKGKNRKGNKVIPKGQSLERKLRRIQNKKLSSSS